MATRKSWTPKEDKLLLEYVKKYDKHAEAFEQASKKLGRSSKAVEQHYYKLSKNQKHVLALYENKSFVSRIISSVRGIFI